ncbi:D-aspartate oxidase [Athalia rosae]|uniref:D-aspartate oxidase n=1 Tax=Athalia rosae TaxID=37344 RepID=UPI0020346AB2|nr:D-aspartate oxidase [Athalia rosae]
MKIAVIGAGIVGVTTSLAIQEAFPDHRVTIFAELFSPETTGDGSAGLWGPYILGDTPENRILRWSSGTHRWLSDLWKKGWASDAGVSLIPVTRVTSAKGGYPDPVWKSTVFGAREIGPDQLKRLSEEHGADYTGGWRFVTFTGEPARLIPWVLRRFTTGGGKIERRKIVELEELALEGFDLVVNYAGLGARELANDFRVKPVRGQVTRVEALWAFNVFISDDDDSHYVIPNIESVVLGGTHQEDDYDREIREEDTKFIHEGCLRILPALRGARILRQWAGLRPGRSSVRLEIEFPRGKNGRTFPVIHNYGHGGSGVTLSWGCASEVVQIIKDNFCVSRNNIDSKL